MNIVKSKIVRVLALIVLSIASILFTYVIGASLFYSQNKPSVLGVLYVVSFDTFTIWFAIHNFCKKKK